MIKNYKIVICMIAVISILVAGCSKDSILEENKMNKEWKRLIANYEKKFEGYSDNLNPGISRSKFESYETEFGFKLPEDMRELYEINNGDKRIFIAGSILGMEFLSMDRVLAEWKMQQDVLASFSEEQVKSLEKYCKSVMPNTIKCNYINNKWIPIGSDSGGNYIGIDLDPDINGKVGQIINFGRDENEKVIIADSLYDFVVLMANIAGSDECVVEDFEGEKVFVFDGHWHAIEYLKSKSNQQ